MMQTFSQGDNIQRTTCKLPTNNHLWEFVSAVQGQEQLVEAIITGTQIQS